MTLQGWRIQIFLSVAEPQNCHYEINLWNLRGFYVKPNGKFKGVKIMYVRLIYFRPSLLFEIQSKSIKMSSRQNWEAEWEHTIGHKAHKKKKITKTTLPWKLSWPLWARMPLVLKLLLTNPVRQRPIIQAKTLNPEIVKWGYINCMSFSERVVKHGSRSTNFWEGQCEQIN